MKKLFAPTGKWIAAISADLVSEKALRFGGLRAYGDAVFWIESRPDENGRNVLVRWSQPDGYQDLTPAPFSARSQVHEYGGGAFLPTAEACFFVNDADQDIYRVTDGGKVEQLTAEDGLRFADFDDDPVRNRLVSVCEDHRREGHPLNMLVAIGRVGASAGQAEILEHHYDFYAFPRVSPAGDRLCFLAWQLPYMPWEAAVLCVCDIRGDGTLGPVTEIAGGPGRCAFQPSWDKDGQLYFVAEMGDLAQLNMFDGKTVNQVTELDGEAGRPLWGLGTTSYALLGDGKVALSYIQDGRVHFDLVDIGTDQVMPLDQGFVNVEMPSADNTQIAAIVTEDRRAPAIAFYAASGEQPTDAKILRFSAEFDIQTEDISIGKPVTYAGRDGGLVHALYYPPTNRRFAYQEGDLPPAIVSAHGGPTGMADRGLKLKIQFWTNRGFAYLDVDYRGSTGFGKAYREALNGRWGILDVEDVAKGADWLKENGLADPLKIAISGSSAGGYTVLQALVNHNVFSVGAAYYGISDLEKLAAHTHKFESGYIFALTGTTPEEHSDIFHKRSPVHHAETITAPVIFFQGSEDKVVPPDQSRLMASSLKQRGIPVTYVEFEGEGHGFRQPQHVRDALLFELSFYNRIMDIQSDEDLPNIEIENFD